MMRYLSLFSGIESATLAWEPLGWTPVAFSEIEPFCNALLEHHYPTIPNLGDIKDITEFDLQSLGSIDIIVFGSPCQDLSVAGKRSGLSGNRSGLFTKAIDIIHWAIKHNNLRYAVWENVPGVFSSNSGKDFQEVLRLFTGNSHHLREKKKWQTSGIALGSQSLCEWRVLDAQHFGVPQRRRRVFAFVDFTGNERAEPVLFEPQGVCGNPPQSRPQKEDLADTLEARTTGGGFPGSDGACSNHIVVDSPQPFDMEAFGQYGNGTKASTLKQRDYKDATDLVIEPLPIHDQATRSIGKRADKQDGKGNGNGLGIGKPGDPMNTLTSGDHHAVCYCGTQNDALRDLADEKCPTLRAGSNGGVVNPVVSTASIVRRLTPTECERLQGIPDDWTKIPYRKKTAENCPDTPRYRAIGNAMAVPVMHWIGKRIESVCSL
ncbi:DNA cytosine methyltransferase [Endozoicomonas sp.]|uniref:DNA cytosine methyltransferase n=1 Tax=Endozoicomonas sp. TaxID=1892382 RepID=UPI00383B7074